MSEREQSGAVAPSGGRSVRVRRHVVPALAVLVGASTLLAVGVVVVFLVFLVDDAAEPFGAREAVVGLTTIVATAIGITLAAFVVGLVLDRVTVGVPVVLRAVAPLALPLLGVAMVVAGADVGYLAVEFGVVLCGYWAVFLLQNGLMSALRRLRASLQQRRRGQPT
jgi:hypothetical protein